MFKNLKYSVKRACLFHLNLVGILSILILLIKNRAGWRAFAQWTKSIKHDKS